jgi:hypothetical protein
MTIRNLLLAGSAVLALGTASAFAADPAPRAQSNDVIRSGTPTDTMTAPAAPRSMNSAEAHGPYSVIKNDDAMVAPYNITVGKLEGTDVIGANNEKIGDVDDVLADSSGKAVAVSVDAGSFFKMNKKEVIMPLSNLTMRDGKLHTSMNKDQVSALPEHNN